MSIPTAQAVAAALPPPSSARHRVIELFAGVGVGRQLKLTPWRH